MREQRYSTAEVAGRVGVHRDTLLRWLREGRLQEPSRDRNGWRSFSTAELQNIERFVHSDRRPALEVRGPSQPALQKRTVDDRRLPNPVAALQGLDWDFAGAKTNYLTHGLHPYPAKFIPQIPNALIQELSSVGDVVADIFCGSGTTLVEALTLKRHAIGVDANPLACLITEAKTTPLHANEVSELQELATQAGFVGEQLEDSDQQGRLFAPTDLSKGAVPSVDAIQFWFEPLVIEELGQIRAWTNSVSTLGARTLARAAFSSIIVSVSRQDSDTRYVRRQKNIRRGDVLKRFCRALTEALRAAAELTELLEPRFTSRVVHASVLDGPDIGPVDLVVCSPPYPNAYSYHLYHMTRMLWLGMDQPSFKRIEIGSHRKYSAKGPRAATNDTFMAEMSRIFAWMRQQLRLDRYACFVVGDSTIGGKRFNNANTIAEAAGTHGFIEVARIERRLQDTKKAFNPAIGKIKREHIVILHNRRDRQ